MPSSTPGTILTQLIPRRTGKLAHVTISRPSKLNSLNTPLLTQLPQTLRTIHEQHRNDLRAIILTGDGAKSFIGGADIPEMRALQSPAGLSRRG